jgi:ribosomal protein S18 acetylase RimI-like enzyme
VKSAERPTRIDPASVVLRDTVRPDDAQIVRDLVVSTGFFADHEVDVAVELVQERLSRGEASGYFFVFADLKAPPLPRREGAGGGFSGKEQTVGYVCYGPIACTVGSYDLYWLAVDQTLRNCGLGRILVKACEDRVAKMGGRRIYIETAGRELYKPTQAFYERCGYKAEAVLKDFYSPGDPKIIYSKAM